MRHVLLMTLVPALAVFSAACASTDDDPDPGADKPAKRVTKEQSSADRDPTAVKPGYTRIVAPVVEQLEPGDDVTRCQYIMAPTDQDMDVLDVTGYQSRGWHHAVAYATQIQAPIGTSRPCEQEDNLLGGFLGGIGGEASAGVKLPEGVAFRLPKGSAILLNTHFLNTGDETLEGHTTVDFKFVPADPNRKVASMFINGPLGFKLSAGSKAQAMAECKLPQEMKFLLWTNHMHDYGAKAKTEVVRKDGSVELVHEDPSWTYEMQFNAVYSKWTLDQPLVIGEGETVRTYCDWMNGTGEEVAFPREMCFGIGFFISDGSTSPMCLDGRWGKR